MGISASIFGCSGLRLTDEERSFFRELQPWGFILFGRNISEPDQVAALVDELKACVDHDPVPVLIDQEGGRVRRLRPPHWPEYGSGRAFGELYARDHEKGLRLAWLQSRLMAIDLQKLGINVDCLPVVDVPVAGSHDVIGDRAYSSDAEIVGKIGQAACDGLLDGGVLPVIKHIPGHGRAGVDSHKALPVVDTPFAQLEKQDFAPFRVLNEMPLAMTAHVVYEAIDSDAPATSSRRVIDEVIRKNIGFDGLLMCDDLSMHALSGDFGERTQSAFAAGCDVVLHCNGDMAEMTAIADAARSLEGKPLARAMLATELINVSRQCDEADLREEYATLSGYQGYGEDPTEAGL